jgi:hypothetical protein
MKTARILFAALVIALAGTACADVTGPAHENCPTMGGGGTCES